MKFLDLTLATPEENLALDEGLLEAAEPEGQGETLRLWEALTPIVVVGRSSRLAEEVDLDYCRQAKIPVLRRTSGGAAIVCGPGCLMYAVVQSYHNRPALRFIERAHEAVLETNVAALETTGVQARRAGTSDLAVGERKFSGNSLRAKQGHFLYHGTLLYDFDLDLISKCLKLPPRQPDYRQGRGHLDFVMNLKCDVAALRRALVAAWNANDGAPNWSREKVQTLVAARYANDEWNAQR